MTGMRGKPQQPDVLRMPRTLGTLRAAGGQVSDRDPRRLAIAGWVLYAISWVTPSLDGRQLGAVAFVDSVKFGWHLLNTQDSVLGLCVLAGWLANFSIFASIFARLPAWLRVVCSIAPWLAFTVVLLKLPVRPSLPARAAYFVYFYPWAVGIGLIHAAHIAAARRNANEGCPKCAPQ